MIDNLIDGLMGAAGASTPKDAQFNYVTMLLHGDGTNGAQNNTFLDSSTNNFTITRNGNTTQGSFSPYGSNWSNYFDGSTSYLSVPSSSALAFGTGDFTVELWVNYYSDTGNYVLYDGRGTSILTQIGFVIYLAGGTLYAQQGTTPIVTTTSPTANTWHHIAFSRSGSSNKFFVDGTQVGTTVTDSTNYSTAYSVGIGTTLDSSYTSSYDLNGYLSNVRVVKGSAVYTSNFTPSTTPLTAISGTSLLTCQSNRFVDNSTNNFAITATGTPSVQRFNPFGASTAYSTSVIGGSGYFDGAGDYLQTTATQIIPASTTYTIESWIYFTGTYSDYYDIICQGTSGNAARLILFIDITTGQLKLQIGANGYSTGVTIIKNQWYHLAVRNNAGTYNIYVNGVSVATGTDSTTPQNTSLIIGAFSTAAEYFPGYISDVRISSTARTITVPTAPYTSDANTRFLANMTNAGIYDSAMMNDLETVGNAQISTSVVKYGTGSLYFNGSAYLFEPSNQANTLGAGNFTIEAWVYPTDVNGTICEKGYGLANGFLFWYQSGQLRIRTYNGSSTQTNIFASGVINLNVWQHVAAVRSSGTITLYVNGTSVASGADTDDLSSTDNFQIGAYDGYTLPVQGYIDDFRISKYARYTTTFTPPTSAFPNRGPI